MSHWAVCSGGNQRGAYQAGAIYAVDHEVEIDAMVGTSIGSWNSLFMSYVGREGMKDIWLNMRKKSQILDTQYFKALFNCTSGLHNMNPAEKLMKDIVTSNDRQMPAWATYVDFWDPKLIHTENRPEEKMEFVEACLRSGSVVPGHELRDGRYADGGFMDQTPLSFAIKNGATKISVFLTSPLEWEHKNGWRLGGYKPLSATLRAVDIISHEVYRNDVAKCMMNNDIPGKRKIDIKVYAPKRVLSELDDNDIQPKAIEAAFWSGYRETAAEFGR